MIYLGNNYHHCLECKCFINPGDIITQGKWGYYCLKCSERKNMPYIKITAEVDGKQVPLENISTETFEAIKALQTPKETPIARIGNYRGDPTDKRLFLKITKSIRNYVANDEINMIAIELSDGYVCNSWPKNSIENLDLQYENIIPL